MGTVPGEEREVFRQIYPRLLVVRQLGLQPRNESSILSGGDPLGVVVELVDTPAFQVGPCGFKPRPRL